MDIFNLDESIAKDLLINYNNSWECMNNIGNFIIKLANNLPDSYTKIGNVIIAKDAIVDSNACIIGPCIIDHNANIRSNAYIRENVIIGKNCIINCEVKNSIIFNNCHMEHLNYIGDSIIGYNVNIGAGTITANLRLDKKYIVIGDSNTNSNKMGSFIGDNCIIGCNCVLNPGCVIGKNCIIYPLNNVSGIIKSNSIYESKDKITKIVEHV